MERCRCCNKRIDPLDFYVSTAKGPICSSCLVRGKPPRQEVTRLFAKSQPKPETDNQLEMSLKDLEDAVRCF